MSESLHSTDRKTRGPGSVCGLRGVLALVAAMVLASSAACLHAAGPTVPPVPNVPWAKQLKLEALRLAVIDLRSSFGRRYPGKYVEQLSKLLRQVAAAAAQPKPPADLAKRVEQLRREALLANPLLSFDKLLLVKRNEKSPRLGLPQNWQGNCALPRNGFANEIAVLSPIRPDGKLTTLYRPKKGLFVGDVDLRFDGRKMLFSSIGSHNRWQIFEIGADGRGLRQVTPGNNPDVDNYDACYLPDGRIIFGSTRCFQGVPCVGGGNQVANLFIMNANGSGIRQLTFDQDHGWCPSILNNGQVLFTRWEYSDSPHYFTRLVMSMNPDGTAQSAYYGSNSYWPNSTFYARAIPGDPDKFVGVVSGHHGVARMGELFLFDPSRGRNVAEGVVQQIPGRGKKFLPVIRDQLVNASWPRFLHPYPLSEKHFLVSCRPTDKSRWGVYLVDVFDNMVLVREEKDHVLFEPVPFRDTKRPPVIPDKVDLSRKDAVVYMTDVYKGGGLAGVPRGSVKKLRVYEFHYAYNRMGGHIHIGIDGPWDVRRIRGTVPVEPDGSALFIVPANTPLAVQPLDAEGKALQIMRSWFTAMPGERLSCVGCHERRNDTSPNVRTMALAGGPSRITPWRGPTRGFSFAREVQPVLDKYCLACHNGTGKAGKMLDLRASQPGKKGIRHKKGWRGFTASYVALHPYVRRPGPESDYHLMPPLEYHADTSELVQMLRKGHGGVKLSPEAWDRLITWIDLNVPDHGTWTEHKKISGQYRRRRVEMRKAHAGLDGDPEKITPIKVDLGGPAAPAAQPAAPAEAVTRRNRPLAPAEAARLQALAGPSKTCSIELAKGVNLEMVLIRAGRFLMGEQGTRPDEQPQCSVKIDKPFWMGKFEITNQQYALFDPKHDSRYVSWFNKDQNRRGEPVNLPAQPVVRLSWRQAVDFTEWLSGKAGRRFSLPTEAQWEYACRAGTDTPMNYGGTAVNFAKLANMADSSLLQLCRRDSPKWIPTIASVTDGATVTAKVGRYGPNAWGLHEMHGNAGEWTLSRYRPYPYRENDGRNDPGPDGRKVLRGGSFYDRPKRCRSAFRLSYPSWQRVYNAGFRVVCRLEQPGPAAGLTVGGKKVAR